MKKQDGQILIFAMVFMFIMSTVVAALVSYAAIQIKSHRQAVSRVLGLGIAEAGVEMALWKLNNQAGYAGEIGAVYGDGTYDVVITDIAAATKLITVEAYVPDAANPRAKRIVQVTTTTNTDNVSFNYGAQVGEGGLELANNTTINGNVYSNGNITGGTDSAITGTAIAANGSLLVADQVNDAPVPPATLISFRNASASADVAQSFQTSVTDLVNKVELYIRKVGNPGNFSAIRIVNDNAGNPGPVTIATGSLNASTITANYGWVTVNFSTNPTLTAGTTYWLVLDASGTSAGNYYQWAANATYASGLAKTGAYSGGPWNLTGADGYFRLYLGGVTHKIDSVIVGTGLIGDARSHTVEDSTIRGNNYCQVGSGNNKVCNTTQPDPTALALPLSDGNLRDWESDASAGGTIGTYLLTNNDSASLGPVKIDGDLTVDNGATLNITGTIWVTGQVIFGNNAVVHLDPAYGALSGIIIAGIENDPNKGYIEIVNNALVTGSGAVGSYIMLISQRNNESEVAIKPSNNSGGAIYYAGDGFIEIDNNAALKEVTAYKISIKNGASVTYESGLASAQFTSGPGASWEIQSQSWQLLQ